MTSMNIPGDDDDAEEKGILSLFSSLSKARTSTAPAGGGASSTASSAGTIAAILALHEKLNGPDGVVNYLVPRLWMSANDDDVAVVMGDDALAIMSLLVECRPAEYVAISASAVRRDIERVFATDDRDDDGRIVSDALISAVSWLLVGTNGDDRVGVASDAHSSLPSSLSLFSLPESLIPALVPSHSRQLRRDHQLLAPHFWQFHSFSFSLLACLSQIFPRKPHLDPYPEERLDHCCHAIGDQARAQRCGQGGETVKKQGKL